MACFGDVTDAIAVSVVVSINKAQNIQIRMLFCFKTQLVYKTFSISEIALYIFFVVSLCFLNL